MTLIELQNQLKEIRTIVNTELPISFDTKDLYNRYQDKIEKVTTLIEVNNKLGIQLSMQLISVANAKDKDYINVKEFELLYSYGASWQKERRNRIHNPLPTVSQFGKKILYDHKTIKEWIQNEIFK